MKSFLRKNLGLKVFSLLLALFLWASIVSRAPEVGTFRIPIVFDTDDHQILVEADLRIAEVQMEGYSSALERVSIANVHAFVPLKNLAPGQHTVVIVPDEIQRVPRGITKTAVLTSGFSITLDTRESRLLPVRLHRTEDLPAGFRITDITIQPTDVEVTGPSGSFKQILEIPTETLDLSKERVSFTRHLKLVPPGKRLIAAPSSIRLSVEIEEVALPQELILDVVPSQPGWTVEPARVTVTIEAPPSLLPRLQEQLRAQILVESLPTPAGGEAVVLLDWGLLEISEMPLVREAGILPAKVRALPPANN